MAMPGLGPFNRWSHRKKDPLTKHCVTYKRLGNFLKDSYCSSASPDVRLEHWSRPQIDHVLPTG
jgi:hypothetical protein